MSELCGIFYFDRRDVSACDPFRLASDSAGWTWYPTPGAWLGQRGSVPYTADSGTVDPETGNVCVGDARLDCPTSTNAEIPVASALAHYQKRGVHGFSGLIGDWSFAISDLRRGEIVLARDYIGNRPLYYEVRQDCAVWSSRLSRLVDLAGTRRLDRGYAAQFLSGWFTTPRTPYQGILPVPCGTAVRISQKGVSIEPFWNPPAQDTIRYPNEADYEEEFRLHFSEAVGARLKAHDVAVAELSGGLDSTSIVCMAKRLISRGAANVSQLFTVNYHHQGSVDGTFYQPMQSALSLPSITLEVAKHPAAVADCSGDIAPTWWRTRLNSLSAQMTARNATVLLTGQLGDLVMGNWVDDSEQVGDLLRQWRLSSAWRESHAWAKALGIPAHLVLLRSFRSAGQGSTHSRNRDLAAAGSCHEDSLTLDVHQSLREMATLDTEEAWKYAPPTRRKRLRALNSIRDGRVLQCPEPMQDLSMTHPYSHRPLLEFMFRAPARIVCGPGEPRRLMRRALRGIVPEAILQRRSKGSYHYAFLDAIRPLAQDMLASRSLRVAEFGLVQPESLRPRLRSFLEGLDCNHGQLRNIVLFEFWLRGKVWLAAS